MENPKELFELASLATFGGASLAVVVLTKTYNKLTGRGTLVVAFVASQVVAFIGAYASGALTSWLVAFVAFLNGCLLFCTAAGMNETAAAAGERAPIAGTVAGLKGRHWNSSWFR